MYNISMNTDFFNRVITSALLSIIFFNIVLLSDNFTNDFKISKEPDQSFFQETQSTPTLIPTPTTAPFSIPESHIISGGTHAFQTFNNCGPASLSMALSFYGINVSQKTLGDELRPYQNAAGDNDDKSVTLSEIAEKGREFGFTAYLRPNGDIEKIKKFVANDIPVITRTITKSGEDIGHYRVVYGYNEPGQVIIQNDSLQGKGLEYEYQNFLELWKTYGYEYLVLVPDDKIKYAESVMGPDANESNSWKNAVKNLEAEIANNPNDIPLRFSLSVAHYYTGDYSKSIEEFEVIESKLPFRQLWYQIEPLLAYQKLKRHDELLPRIEAILNNHNRAFSELYQMRGEIYLAQGKIEQARQEFELALFYNNNFEPAQKSLDQIS
jgi:tetratricopeptide (TPR) repeat protein